MYRERIRQSYDNLSPGYRRIGDYLLASYQDAAFNTAAEIARSAHVDTALVVRFAQRLGYLGFPELHADIREHVKHDLRATYDRPTRDASASGMFQQIIDQDRANLETMRRDLDWQVVATSVTLLESASKVLLIGEANINHVCSAFALPLQMLGINAHVLPGDFHSQAVMLAEMGSGALLVAMGATGLAHFIAAIVKTVRAAGADTLGIVGSLTDPIAGAAEHVMVAPARTVGYLPSFTAHAALLHALTQMVALDRPERGASWLMRAHDLLEGYRKALLEPVPQMRKFLEHYSAAAWGTRSILQLDCRCSNARGDRLLTARWTAVISRVGVPPSLPVLPARGEPLCSPSSSR